MELGHSNADDDAIPDFVQSWHPSVRRPITSPNPAIYHEAIHPRAIFELRETPSSEYFFVVPYSCTHCCSSKQACSRLRPCDRCTKVGKPCTAYPPGYQKLPPPKGTKPRNRASIPSSISGMSRAPSVQSPSEMAAASRADQSITTSSNPPSPKKQKLTHSSSPSPPKKPSKRRGNNKKVDANPPQNVPLKESIDPEASNGDASTSTAPVWTFMRPAKAKRAADSSVAIPAVNAPPHTPRVWANSRAEIASIFPELTKSVTGILWRQFEMPALFLEHPRPDDAWKGQNTLEITLEWGYKCGPELLVCSEPHDIADDKRLSDNNHATQVECESVKHSMPSFTPIKRDYLQFDFSSFAPPIAVGSEALPSNITTASQLSMLAPAPLPDSPPSPVLSPSLVPQPDSPAMSPSAAPKIQPQVPAQKPSEIETLVQCHMHKVPLLVFVSRESGLLPRQLPPEYAYSCLGLFFISDMNADINNTVIAISKTQKCGRVRWRLTLEWAPGGEDGLLEHSNEKPHPWWIDPVDYPVEKDTGSVKIPYRPRDLSEQYFSFLPLDLLADFKPNEFFPRGWYCRECGMLNAQRCFRHQICESSGCKRKMEGGKAKANNNCFICHVDPLQALRELHHLLPIGDPLDDAPSSIGKIDSSWDDRMRTLTYQVNSGARVQHIFTGNQEILQQDATKLLLDIQKDVILSRSDLHSPYFTWSMNLDPAHKYTEDPAGQPEIPMPIFDIHDVLLHYMQAYGEINDANINRILIQAWVTPGSKRGAIFNAKGHAVMILCLGAEVVMNLVPKHGFSEIPIESAEDRMEVDSERILTVIVPDGDGDRNAANQPDPASLTAGESPGSSLLSGIVWDSKAARKWKGTGGKKSKQAPLELSVTLVHGDAVILEGDDFEYQIKRSGTTILLIGSYE
ncbi:uncharacterized protein EDB91DRAFT_1114795 [Suillus paluster]|uniref:uncharacterized protein n=1 Tax=Suillus paluster TaxID=48578 RepID=UPI001B85E412|nr:uncharacterized protein EDB91DRAFT_1114795 [Suillus paluster]KAG1747776.1 hypothetical protein EDB91DRAFT_1114795 [Suillus paluster]